MIKMKNRPLSTFLFSFSMLIVTLCLFGCGEKSSEISSVIRLRVAAAADLKFAMDALITRFNEAHSDIAVDPTYGSSGNFYAQIQNGAPFDLYFSADVKYPNELLARGSALNDEVFPYAIGRIVVWVSKSSPIDPKVTGIDSLFNPSVKKIAIANPEHAPYGVAAVAAMKSLGVYERAKPRFVLGENIAQTAQFIDTGAVDIGIVALALAIAPAMSDKGKYWEIPTTAFPEMLQGGMIVKGTPHPEAAKAFRDFVLGEEGRRILKKFGFYLLHEQR